MKKITKIFLIMTVVAATLLTTSCDLFNRAKEWYEQTYDTWYKYNKEVTVPVAGTNDSATDGMLKNASVYVKFNPTDGLDVLVCTTHEQTIEYMGIPYEVKATIVTGGKKHYDPDTSVNSASWIVMMETGRFEEQNPPEITVDLSDLLKGNFDLKRMLVKLLVGYLDE